MSCPICKRSVKKSDSDFPFCSERCRTIDLGNWASEKYVISSPITSQRDPRQFPEGEFPESHDED